MQVYSEIFQIFIEPSNSAVPYLPMFIFSRGMGSCVPAIVCDVPTSGSEATGGAKPSHYRTWPKPVTHA